VMFLNRFQLLKAFLFSSPHSSPPHCSSPFIFLLRCLQRRLPSSACMRSTSNRWLARCFLTKGRWSLVSASRNILQGMKGKSVIIELKYPAVVAVVVLTAMTINKSDHLLPPLLHPPPMFLFLLRL
jgi:hypothetical protein